MQHGFFFDQSRCTGCRVCTVACKSWRQLPAGPLKYLKLYEYEKGAFPQVRLHFQWAPCYHCDNPVCLKACPNKAIYKEDKFGAVLIDGGKCQGHRACYKACPYGAPVFPDDAPGAKAQKCDMCIDRLEAGDKPICVSSCASRALDFGPLGELQARYGDNRDIEDMPRSSITRPSVIFKPHTAKKQLVPYDAKEALELMMKRDPLPPVFGSLSDVTEIADGLLSRGRLVLKHTNADELMRQTRCDES